MRADHGDLPPPPPPPTSVGPGTRRAVHVFLLVFVVCGVAHLELWPLTGFRLFSELRGAQRSGWSIVAVDPGGSERTVDLGELPVGYRNTSKRIPGLVDGTPAEQADACSAWATPLREDGWAVAGIRVYATVSGVRPDSPPPRRTLAFECDLARPGAHQGSVSDRRAPVAP